MSLLQGSGGARPSKPMSLLGAIVGVGILVCAVLFLVAPDLGVSVFIGLWVLIVLTTIGYHVWNATARHGIDHTRFDFHAENAQRGNNDFAERLRELEKLHGDGLISNDEYQKKRAQIMGENW